MRFLVCAVLLGAGMSLTVPVFAQGCKDQKWCAETSDFAFRIIPEAMTVEQIQQMAKIPGSPDMAVVIDELMQSGRSRMYMGWLRPTPEMRSVTCAWNVGLQLKSGEVVWATKWILQVGRSYVGRIPSETTQFVPGLHGTSPSGNSFIMFLVFPSQSPNGKTWKRGHVSDLTIG